MASQDGHQLAGAAARQARPGCGRKVEGGNVGAGVDEGASCYRFEVQAFGLPLPPQICGKLNLHFDDDSKVVPKLRPQHSEGRSVLVTIGIATSFTAGSPAFRTR